MLSHGSYNSNELHSKINEHKSIVADMLSDWKGYGPDILKQPGENTGEHLVIIQAYSYHNYST